MDEMLERQNMGLLSSSIAADQLLSGNSINIQDMTRLALELSMEKDHDVPYFFALPISLPERLAWLRLLSKVPETVAVAGSGQCSSSLVSICEHDIPGSRLLSIIATTAYLYAPCFD